MPQHEPHFSRRPAPGPLELPAALQPYAAAIAAHLQQPAAFFVPLNQLAASATQSKIGGWPYLPQQAPNPLLGEDGAHRYNLLLQVNLAELPEPRPQFFPREGMLQVFTRGREDLLDGWRDACQVVYYPTLLPEAAQVTDFAAFDLHALEGYEGVPAEGLAVAFKSLTENTVEQGDDFGGLPNLFAHLHDPARENALLDLFAGYLVAYNAAMPATEAAWVDEVAAQYPRNGEQLVFRSPQSWWGYGLPDHQLGGLPGQFWQGDPRLEWEDGADEPRYDRLLLAYDARGNCTEWAVPLLGDDAKLHFFINRDHLQQLNFSNILFDFMA